MCKKKEIVIYGYLNNGVWLKRYKQDRTVIDPKGVCETLNTMQGGGLQPKVVIYEKNIYKTSD